jgi:hypothetical protein
MSSDDSKLNGQAYVAACDRVLHHVVELVNARGIEVSLEIDPGRAPFEVITNTHQIQLTYGGITCVLPVDHETFMDPEFFRTLVLHQLEKTIDELAQRD